MDLDEWQYPKRPIVPVAETVHERYSVEIFRGCTRGCRFCQAGMITRPVRERSIDAIAQMVDGGLQATGLEEVGLLSLSSADHSEISDITKGLADRYEGTNVSLSLPSTRVDTFNIDLANELSRNGRRSGLTFAPEGGSERMRRVINKKVTEEDLIRTVATAFGNGWRQIKLYFMCGLPTETDEDVLGIHDMASHVVAAGRAAAGRKDIRCTISIGGFVPKPHTPFQWAAQASADEVDHRLSVLRDSIRADRQFGRSIGMRYHDGRPGIIEGLLSRGDRRVGNVIEAVWRDGGVFLTAGMSTSLTIAGLPAASGNLSRWASHWIGLLPVSATTRRYCPGTTWILGSIVTGYGTTGRMLWTARPSTTVAGIPAMTAGCARRWAPRFR
ncbi:Fe-S oxidoreductase [Cutibacterium acnes JCM 18916]|nr:Fe-S oxidoreductase [Cutibacterium acnes JCM 18916]